MDNIFYVNLAAIAAGQQPAAPTTSNNSNIISSTITNSNAASSVNENSRNLSAKKKEKENSGGNVIAISYNPPMGTRDFYPPEMRFRNWLFGTWREIARKYAFEEFDAPVLENEDLYKRKAGEEIVQQMYNFVDKDGYNVTLRPEMTPTLARMVLADIKGTALPVKWFSIPQCWRYENVQRGRKREHFQWNMDIVGVSGVTAEAELLSAIVDFFKSVGITSNDVGIKINSRKLLQSILDGYQIPAEMLAPVCVVVDKLDKIGREAVVKELLQLNVSKDVAEKIVDVLSIRDIAELSKLAEENKKTEEAIKEIKELFEYAEGYGISDFLRFDASVVRGLAYYTGIVFEGFDKSGELRAICGGGRYDKLLSLYGSPKEIPACGFGFGDCVIKELLEMKNLIPKLSQGINVVIAPFNAEYRKYAMQVASLLRRDGLSVDVYLETSRKKVKECFAYADRLNAPWVVFVAPDEWVKGQVRVKDMTLPDGDTNKEKDVNLANLPAFIRQKQ